jgi:flagellar protein FlaJ
LSEGIAQQVQRAREPKAPLTLLDRFSALGYSLFGRRARAIARSMPRLDEELLKSNLRLTPEGLISAALLVTLLTGAAAAALAAFGLLLGLPILALSLLCPPLAFMLMLNAPKLSQASRAYAIDNELPHVIGFMVVLAGGGVSPMAAMRRIAEMGDVFPAASKEAKRILVDTDVFGMDPISALEKAARYSPSRGFSEVLYGYTTVLKTGGDYVAYLANKQRDIFEARSARVKRSSEVIGILAEAYLSLSSLLGITLFVLYEVQAVLTRSEQGVSSLLLFSLLVIPLISAIFIWLLDQIHIKQPYVDMRPFRGLIASLPLAIALLFLPIPLSLFLRTALVLGLLALPPALLQIRYARERKGIERALPEFIKDMAEGRRIGLAPEASIAHAAEKNYGHLSRYVRKMAAQIAWGLPLSKVMGNFVRSVQSWVARAIGTLILEVIDVGGGTVKSFTDLADFTGKMNELEAERRSSLRPYIFVMYLSGLMTIITALLMVYLMTSASPASLAAPNAAPSISPQLVDLFLAAAIFDGWVAGLVAGKMSEGSLADGFKHGVALALASVAVIYVTAFFLRMSLP